MSLRDVTMIRDTLDDKFLAAGAGGFRRTLLEYSSEIAESKLTPWGPEDTMYNVIAKFIAPVNGTYKYRAAVVLDTPGNVPSKPGNVHLIFNKALYTVRRGESADLNKWNSYDVISLNSKRKITPGVLNTEMMRFTDVIKNYRMVQYYTYLFAGDAVGIGIECYHTVDTSQVPARMLMYSIIGQEITY